WSGSYLIIHLNLCLWSPAIPVPPRPPAPRPCFLPRPWVRLPRNLRVLETIRRLLDEHPLQEFVDRLPAVAEVAAVVVSALDAAVPFARRRQADHGPQLPDVLQGRLAFRDRLAQVPDRLVLAVSLHERIVHRLVADLAPPTEEELREDLRVDLAPCSVILGEAAVGGPRAAAPGRLARSPRLSRSPGSGPRSTCTCCVPSRTHRRSACRRLGAPDGGGASRGPPGRPRPM